MKKQLPAFFTGFLVAALVLSLSLSAFAAITGKTTIEVGPISIMVKGKIFQPTDVNGNPVDVFVYNGTTYAPLRALAEAYGLEVSYDGEAKMAVVEEPSKTTEAEAIKPEYTQINMVHLDGKYLLVNEDPRLDPYYYIATYDNESLLFSTDISIASAGNLASWDLQYIIRIALLEQYKIIPTDNPYADGIFSIESPSYLDRLATFNCGVDEKVYISATESYTPMWLEYRGERLYNQHAGGGYQEINGIRYYNGYVCVNDILTFWGIEKDIVIGEHNGVTYIEVK